MAPGGHFSQSVAGARLESRLWPMCRRPQRTRQSVNSNEAADAMCPSDWLAAMPRWAHRENRPDRLRENTPCFLALASAPISRVPQSSARCRASMTAAFGMHASCVPKDTTRGPGSRRRPGLPRRSVVAKPGGCGQSPRSTLALPEPGPSRRGGQDARPPLGRGRGRPRSFRGEVAGDQSRTLTRTGRSR